MKRLGPVGQSGPRFVNWCGVREDVWKAVGSRNLTVAVTSSEGQGVRDWGRTLN